MLKKINVGKLFFGQFIVGVLSFLWNVSTVSSAGSSMSGSYSNSGNLPVNDEGVAGIVSNVTDFLLTLIGILAVLAFVISGIQYLTAAGDEKVAEKAKRTMTYAVIGLVVVLMAVVVIKTVEYLLT